MERKSTTSTSNGGSPPSGNAATSATSTTRTGPPASQQSSHLWILICLTLLGVVNVILFHQTPTPKSHNSLMLEAFKQGLPPPPASVQRRIQAQKLQDQLNSDSQDSLSLTVPLSLLPGQIANDFETIRADSVSSSDGHDLAGLTCKSHGGPDNQDIVDRMVYWRDIPSDASWQSPFYDANNPKYLTFEPDEGGFNNIRMAFETTVGMAIAMGRVLVLPPRMNFYLLTDPRHARNKRFGFEDFYDLERIALEHTGSALRIISFEEFLKREAMTGQLRNPQTNQVTFPPGNRTNWNGVPPNFLAFRVKGGDTMWKWLREEATVPLPWEAPKCVAAFPQATGLDAIDDVSKTLAQVLKNDADAPVAKKMGYKVAWRRRFHSFDGNPTPVDGPPLSRLSEILAQRQKVCIYNQKLQDAKVIHVKGEQQSGFRMLIHFYAFLFFQDWQSDIWFKRFVRDHLRYKDEIQCAAARIVEAVLAEARHNNNGHEGFYSMHVRRGDFQYTQMKIPASEIYEDNIKKWFKPGRTIYIATDEKEKSFFEPIKQHFNVYFMDDFKHLLNGVDTHFYGMIDQLVASQGESFVGVPHSTFTGFINRMRGYHSQKRKDEGYLEGTIDSYYYVPNSAARHRKAMFKYSAVEPPFWAREFAVSWRDIDHSVPDLEDQTEALREAKLAGADESEAGKEE